MRHSDPFLKLKTSRFRRNIHLDEKERNICYMYGNEIIQSHARRFVEERLAKPVIELDDGHQTPKSGHPVFKAMHATATCCRKCLFNWHRIPRYRSLEQHEIDFVVNLIMAWINAKTVS
ncbi:DUF4186 family protein [Candidatus Woesearchaeota archaeon]|nr:DUF4186 family protein [Candidatus Woesearchaeota archaeon]